MLESIHWSTYTLKNKEDYHMIARDTIESAIVERVEATRRVNRSRDFIQTLIKRILDKIDIMNGLPEHSSMCWGKPLNEIVILDEFKDLILPQSVRLDPTDLKTNDLLIKGKARPSDNVSDYVEFLNDQLAFRSLFKKDLSSGTTTFANLFVHKSLFDTLPIACFIKDGSDNEVRSLDDPFIPVPLKVEVSCLFREDYLNSTIDYVINDYFSKKMF